MITTMFDQKPTQPHIRTVVAERVRAKQTFSSSDQTCKLNTHKFNFVHSLYKMSFLVYYLIFHLCVSMHACNSRHLGVFHKEPVNEVRRLTIMAPETMVELEGKNIYGNTIEQKESTLEFLSKHTETDIQMQISQEESKIKGWKNHARSTMESKQRDSKEAINKSKDNSFTEDVVVMDYAQPHRKPPIHNLEP